MKLAAPAPLVYLISSFAPRLVYAQLTGIVDARAITITAAPGYNDQDACARRCLWNFGINDLAGILGCGTNACLCRDDHFNAGAQYLSSCGVTDCTNSNDATGAIAVYSAYCAHASTTSSGPTVTPLVSAPRPTVGQGSGGGVAPSTQTVLSVATVTPTIKDVTSAFTTTNAAGSAVTTTITTALPVVTETDTQSALSESDKISLGVGLGVGIPTFLFGVWVYMMSKKRRSALTLAKDTPDMTSSSDTR